MPRLRKRGHGAAHKGAQKHKKEKRGTVLSNSAPIGFLDSGIGGITVLNEAVRLLPNENYLFFSDSKNNPYGDKSDGEILSHCLEISDFFMKEKCCKAIVIACNTASAKAAKSLRAVYPGIPIAAIEPAYKVVHDETPQGATLIMATKGTIKSEKFRRLYYSYYNHNTSIHACPGLADLIENGTESEILDYLEKTLSPYRGKVKNVVLGCTHYPLIKKKISAVLGNVRFFDGANGVARRLEYLLRENGMLNAQKNAGSIEFIDSSESEEIRKQKAERFYSLLKR